MKKRIISFIMAVSMLMPVSVMAARNEDAPIPEWIGDETFGSLGMKDAKYYHVYQLLDYLGCTDLPAEKTNPDEKITRAEAVSTLAKIHCGALGSVTNESFSDVSKSDVYAGGIYAALQAGLIANNGGKFYPKKYMTLNESGSIALKMLGYNAIPMLDEAAYIDDLDLYKNVQTDNGELTRGNFYIFLENMLTAEAARLSITEPGYSYDVNASGDSYLLENKDINVITGIVTATEYAAIYNKKDFSEGFIEINNMKMPVANDISDDMLGKCVKAYVDIEDDSNVVVSVVEDLKYNKETEISFADFEGYENNQIDYYVESSNKRLKVSETAIVVFNGQYYGGLSEAGKLLEDFDYLKALDNSKDGIADIIFIDKKEYAYVESVSAISESIRTSMGDYLYFSEEECAAYRIFNESGEAIDLANMLPDSIIEYKKAYNYEKKPVYEILVSQSKIVGVLKGRESDDYNTYYNVDGTEYELSDYYERYLSEDIQDEKPMIGNEATFYLSADGKIVFSSANVYSYGFIIKGYCDTDNEDICNLTLYTYDGARVSYNLTEKVKYVTPENPEGKKLEASVVIAGLGDGYGKVRNEVIAFQLDGQKNIKMIATEMDMTGHAPGTVDYPLVKNHFIAANPTAVSSNRVYQQLVGYKWYVPSSVKRMTVPMDRAKYDNEKYFSIGQVKGQGGYENQYIMYEHSFYNADEFYNVGFCITKEDKVELSAQTIEPYMITSVQSSINEDDEEGVMIEYFSKGEKKQAFIKNDTTVVDYGFEGVHGGVSDLGVGDVIQFETDGVGDVAILAILIKADKLPARGTQGKEGTTDENGYFNPFDAIGIIHGTVVKTQRSTESALINISADGKDPKGTLIFRIGRQTANFYNYNVLLKEGKKISVVTFDDIMPGDEVIGIERYNKVTDVYILR